MGNTIDSAGKPRLRVETGHHQTSSKERLNEAWGERGLGTGEAKKAKRKTSGSRKKAREKKISLPPRRSLRGGKGKKSQKKIENDRTTLADVGSGEETRRYGKKERTAKN